MITVRHDQPGSVTALGGLATDIGQGQAATRNAAEDEQRARFLMQFRESQRQNDINAGLRINAQQIEQRQFNQGLAMQDARQRALLEQNAYDRQAQLEAVQMREEYDLFGQQQAQQAQYQQASAKSIDEQVFETQKAAQQMKLNPEGQRILNEMTGKLRAVRQMRGMARPEQYNGLLSQWLGDFEQSNLAAYEQREPTAHEKVYDSLVPLQGQQVVPGQPLPPGMYRSLKGTRNGADTWEMVTIPEPPSPTFAEDVAKNYAPAPDGGVFLRQPDGKVTHIPPTKPEKSTEKPVDTSKYLKEAAAQLRAEHQISQAGSESPSPFKMDLAAAKARAREIMQAEQELEAELAGATDLGDGDEPLLQGLPDLFNAERPQSIEEAAAIQPGKVFFWNGQYARMEDDGTVTVIE